MQGKDSNYGHNTNNTSAMQKVESQPCLLAEPESSPDHMLPPDCNRRDDQPMKKCKSQQQSWSKRLVPAAPTVAGSKVRFEQCRVIDLDIVSRDPAGLNSHCRVNFEDIIAEPDPNVFSFDGVWVLSYKLFTSTKLWCYRITSLICAIPAAICWGIEFACLSFCTIWCWQPSLRAFQISLWYPRRIFEIILAAFLEPCFHAMGKCLSHIVVTIKREG